MCGEELMANREDLVIVERLCIELEDTWRMREAHPELNWYWDRVDVLLERIEDYERIVNEATRG